MSNSQPVAHQILYGAYAGCQLEYTAEMVFADAAFLRQFVNGQLFVIPHMDAPDGRVNDGIMPDFFIEAI